MAMIVIRIIQLTIAFNHSYHTCKFDIDWISILLKIIKSMQILISSPPAPPLPASISCPSPPAPKEIWLYITQLLLKYLEKLHLGQHGCGGGLVSMNKGPNATICLVRRQNHAGTTVSWTTVQREKRSHAYKLSSNVQTACSTDSLNNCPKHSILRFSSFALKIYLRLKMCQHNLPCSIVYAHCLLPGRAFASLYVLLFLEKEAETGGRERENNLHTMSKIFF